MSVLYRQTVRRCSTALLLRLLLLLLLVLLPVIHQAKTRLPQSDARLGCIKTQDQVLYALHDVRKLL